MSSLELSSGALSATIDSRGAQLRSVRTSDGTEYLWDAGDPWHYSAPVLFPIISTLPGSQLASHGLARTSEFRLEGSTFSLRSSAESLALFPYDFLLELTFRVDRSTLTIEHRVSNPGATALPFLLGGHPAFRWPLPGAVPGAPHTVSWERGGATMRQAVNGLRPGRIPSPAIAGQLVLDRAQFAEDAMLFDDIEPREISYSAPGSARVVVNFEDFSRLGIWSKPLSGDFICFEPWTGYPAPQGFAGSAMELPDATILAPGEQRSFRYSITIEEN
jgi:galactose mutarotase-like enzyme